jgi:hypothetical protein
VLFGGVQGDLVVDRAAHAAQLECLRTRLYSSIQAATCRRHLKTEQGAPSQKGPLSAVVDTAELDRPQR